MEKNPQNLKNEDSDFMLRSKGNEEVLEISSTGYGLESVTKKPEDKDLTTRNKQSCGGL